MTPIGLKIPVLRALFWMYLYLVGGKIHEKMACMEFPDTGPANTSHMYVTATKVVPLPGSVCHRKSRISSKYIVPVPPAAGLSFVPMPIVIVLTLVRFTPWSANA